MLVRGNAKHPCKQSVCTQGFAVLIALLLPVLFGIFVRSMFALTPIYIERRQQRLISTASSIQRNIKEIKEYELD
jgi:hypothetical protein